MFPMLLNKNRIILVLLGVAIALITAGTVSSIIYIETPRYSQFYDTKFVLAMNNISKLVPQNESIVASDKYGNMAFFINHELLIPWNASSENSLLYYMVKNRLKYMLVYENFSRVPELKPLFSHEGLKNLNDHFQLIANYTTNVHSSFQLYRLNKNWTFQE